MITYAAWKEEGERRFGPNMMAWRFVCPSCGHVASVLDWKNVGARETEVAFSCIGRHIEGASEAFSKDHNGPCTYAGGGLFRLNPVTVVFPDGHHQDVFAFAPGNPPTPEQEANAARPVTGFGG